MTSRCSTGPGGQPATARGGRRALLVALTLVLAAGSAQARVVMYVTKAGDTPESVAADYYGNRSLALFISEGNGLLRDAKLPAGQKLRIPTAFRYRLHRGDTLEGLAQRFLEDRRRAIFLAQMSGIKPTDKLREGQELVIPFLHVHHAQAPESISSVARAFYGDAAKAKLLGEFNFRIVPDAGQGGQAPGPESHTCGIRSVLLSSAPQGRTQSQHPAARHRSQRRRRTRRNCVRRSWPSGWARI